MLEPKFIPICSPHYQTLEIHLRFFRDCLQKYSKKLQNLKISANNHQCFADIWLILCRYFTECSPMHLKLKILANVQ